MVIYSRSMAPVLSWARVLVCDFNFVIDSKDNTNFKAAFYTRNCSRAFAISRSLESRGILF